MTEPDDPEVIATRERAERVMARRAKEKAERPVEAEPTKKSKKKRQWYHWVIDLALFGLVAYMVKTKFFDKQAEPAAPAPAPRVSASAAPRVATSASTDVFEGPAQPSPRIDTLPPKTPVEVLELSPSGFMKVKTPSGKTGWIPATSVATLP